jgi:hypothetical protein
MAGQLPAMTAEDFSAGSFSVVSLSNGTFKIAPARNHAKTNRRETQKKRRVEAVPSSPLSTIEEKEERDNSDTTENCAPDPVGAMRVFQSCLVSREAFKGPPVTHIQVRHVGWLPLQVEQMMSWLMVPRCLLAASPSTGISGPSSGPRCCDHLRVLDLEGNAIGDAGVAIVCRSIAAGNLPVLSQLLLASNSISHRGVRNVADALRDCALLQRSPNGCLAPTSHEQRGVCYLKVIGLSNNSITDEGVEAVCDMVRHCGRQLQRLFLHHTRLSAAALGAVLACVSEVTEGRCDAVFAAQNLCSAEEYATISMQFRFLRH